MHICKKNQICPDYPWYTATTGLVQHKWIVIYELNNQENNNNYINKLNIQKNKLALLKRFFQLLFA